MDLFCTANCWKIVWVYAVGWIVGRNYGFILSHALPGDGVGLFSRAGLLGATFFLLGGLLGENLDLFCRVDCWEKLWIYSVV